MNYKELLWQYLKLFFLQGIADEYAEKEKIVSGLVDMGFHAEEASAAIDRRGM